MDDARALEDAGAFAIVLESIPPDVAEAATRLLSIPTIGIGAGPWCDGQVLVGHDMLGLTDHSPSFVRQYARLAEAIGTAAAGYVREVKDGRFPERTVPAGTAHNRE